MPPVYPCPGINGRAEWILSHRTLRGGYRFGPIPGNKLTGYDDSVPLGHFLASIAFRLSSSARDCSSLSLFTFHSCSYSFGPWIISAVFPPGEIRSPSL